MIFLEKMFKLVKEVEFSSTELSGLFNNKDEGEFSNWDAHVSYNLNELSNDVRALKNLVIEFDKYLNGPREFERKVLDGIRKEVRKGHYAE